ncbi:Meiotic recombination protein DMC1 like protein [Tritrichomonas foetus]|uniref:Meiotic recombination protein DMC1 like protein n=1 Tax=Tritrichomonas foetus TaxID=1144522 RepID=A0A1J4KIK7_9EUKA|nr:Meiotic recombination protein DMC1 like protein [Tritrichomonas foetus]|eukprot:OHT10898.1 Meiotic recombination protein DMC1 like protein [Tritrichomonas foetus]
MNARVNAPMTDQDEMLEPSFDSIEKLVQAGINAADIKKLKEAGICTVGAVLMETKKRLANVKGISDAKVDKIIAAATSLDTSFSFMSGNECLNRRQRVIHITTGSSELDKLLGGGIESMSITEVFGEFRTGKTQLCHTLCVTSQLPINQGGGAGKVVYIDTEGTFRPERIPTIAARFGVDPNEVLDNILYARAFTHEQQMQLILQATAQMAEDQYRLMIIDSITALFRVDFSGRGELAERQQTLGQMMSALSKVASEFNVAIFITNQVMASPDSALFVQAPKPIGGHILAHASTTRLYLRKGKGAERVAKIYDSPSLPEAEATYELSDTGIIDSTG